MATRRAIDALVDELDDAKLERISLDKGMTWCSRLCVALSAALVAACGCGSDGASTSTTSSAGTGDASSSEGVTTTTSQTSATTPETAGTSASTDGPTTGSTGGNGLSPTAACEAYLACAAATIPAELGPLLETYGPEGSCWQSTPAVAEQCDMACEVGLMQLQMSFPDEPSCGGTDSSSSGAVDPTGGQPDSGMYSMCTTAQDCVGLPICLTNADMTDGFCTQTGCMNAAADCDPAPGGTALPTCIGPFAIDGEDETVCALSCAGGLVCPGGMDCINFPDVGLLCV